MGLETWFSGTCGRGWAESDIIVHGVQEPGNAARMVHMKTKLRLKPVDGQGRPMPIGEDPITLGRHPDNIIRLKDDRASRHHCIVEINTDGTAQVRDLGSRNGTKLNGSAVSESALTHGDVICIGKQEFEIEQEGAKAKEDGKGDSNGKPEDRPQWVKDLRKVLWELPPKGKAEKGIKVVDASGNTSEALSGDTDGPKAMKMLLQVASKARATDIHAEPKPETFQVRMRVDGQMVWIVDLPRKVGDLVCGLTKTACQMKTAGRAAVLDGHYSARFPDRRVDFRVSFTPSVHGQKLVMRVLDQRDAPTSLAELGLAPYMHDRVRRVCEQDHGLLLVCGPTGSGKTTTLYNAVREIDREARNVVTIEDPVEYQLPGVTQMPINEMTGNTFGNLLRSVLRQDPDVILVGEIRDEETARTAMQAAMTGHVVFTTVHAKDTIAAVFRLLDLKVEPYLVANSLDLILAQRLVRVLCDSCKREIPVSPGVSTRLGRYLGGKTKSYISTGCPKCLRTGYRGRHAIFELLDVNDELRDLILSEPSVQAMKSIIQMGLFTTLAQSGWKLVAEGHTSLDEVDRVAGQG